MSSHNDTEQNSAASHCSLGPISWVITTLVIALIIWLAYTEYRSQDCMERNNGIFCNNWIDKVEDTDTVQNAVDKVTKGLQITYTSVGWRRAAIVALVLSLLLKKVFNFGWDKFVIIALMIFIVTYTGYQWFQLHYIKPNAWKVEKIILPL